MLTEPSLSAISVTFPRLGAAAITGSVADELEFEDPELVEEDPDDESEARDNF